MEVLETFFQQVSGDFGDPFEYGGEWFEYRQQLDGVGPALPTGGYMRIIGNDGSPQEGIYKDRCYIEYKHVSKGGNPSRRKGVRTAEWLNDWINNNDRDYPTIPLYTHPVEFYQERMY